MNRSPDIVFMAEYIKNVLYFATVRQGKTLKNTTNTHYFCIDNELIYENYYSDFGPLNLGCVYRYCTMLKDKINNLVNKQTIVHYTSTQPEKKANSAFLLGCYGVLYLSLTPKDALKPLLVHGQQDYRPFQDVTQGESPYTISLLDCLQAIKKARDLGFFNFHDFNFDEYERLDKIQGGDLNWIVPGKFLAFIGPVDYRISLYHPPEMYIDYFLENKVKYVVRLNKKMYDGNVFNNVGIVHYDLVFDDGSTPPRHILLKFLQICEVDDSGAIAVHCKAGLGRTGSLIGCYLIKHYKMTSHEAIGWMRICRPGSVIGHQQIWLERLEPWLLKQGNLYRRSQYRDTEKLPYHEYGIYSIAEKFTKQRPVVFKKSPSPPPPLQKQSIRMNDEVATMRPQNSRIKEDESDNEVAEEKSEIFLTTCDLTIEPTGSMTRLKGCVLKSKLVEDHDYFVERKINETSTWKRYLCCHACLTSLNDALFKLAVRCASVNPNYCNSFTLCRILDLVVINKATEKELDWRLRFKNLRISNSLKSPNRGNELSTSNLQRTSGAGEPKTGRPSLRSLAKRSESFKQRDLGTINTIDSTIWRDNVNCQARPIHSPHHSPVIKHIHDAAHYLMKSSMYKKEHYNPSPTTVNAQIHTKCSSPVHNPTQDGVEAGTRKQQRPQYRRLLGRSPSPVNRMSVEQAKAPTTRSPSPAYRMSAEHTRATSTHPSPKEKILNKNESKSTMNDVLSRLKTASRWDGPLNAGSLSATQGTTPRRAPRVRSDERHLATQGDILNSIKFQKRFRDVLRTEKKMDNMSLMPNNNSSHKEKPITPATRSFFSSQRPLSPCGRRGTQTRNFN